jgi:hypothetical protein
MPQPSPNGVDVNSGSEKVRCGRMANRVRPHRIRRDINHFKSINVFVGK